MPSPNRVILRRNRAKGHGSMRPCGRMRRSKSPGVTRSRCQLPHVSHLRFKSIAPSIRYNYGYSKVITFERRRTRLTRVHQSAVYPIPKHTTRCNDRAPVFGCAHCTVSDKDASMEQMILRRGRNKSGTGPLLMKHVPR